jgi:hypothetical protein
MLRQAAGALAQFPEELLLVPIEQRVLTHNILPAKHLAASITPHQRVTKGNQR